MATIHDVARAAGVSIATVSRALNGGSRVNAETRRHVLETAATLDFRPNHAARGLATGKLGNVGVLLPDVANPFFGAVLAGITRAAQERGFGVFVADSREDAGGEPELAGRLSQQVDGLVLVAPRMPDDDVLTYSERRPTVLVNRLVGGVDGVAVDAAQGMSDLLTQVALLGHRHVCYLDGPSESRAGTAKRAGLTAAAERHGIDLHVEQSDSPTFAAGRAAAQRVLDSGCTAAVCFDDLLAWGVMTRVRELGVDVPGRLSIAGFDDSLEEGMVTPGLTTVAARNREMGTIAAGMLERRLRDASLSPTTEVLRCNVVVRGSTGSAPA
ncbi:LacI family DNA-binding transcriptional regulator [Georgenia halophila]|uniref:LacI family DNA-binding transcriptional regulator n=1 Tax=Georgenia halophila TaxID=620889 RepID=A0ABP8LFM9_9MICO